MDAQGKAVRDCAPDEIGVVTMSRPSVFNAYATGDADAPFVAPCWVKSGDLGRLDADGYLWITGRSKDLIIRGGHNIEPRGVEEALYDHPEVQVAALVGEPDAYAGELPVAYIQLRSGATVGPDDLKAWTAARTPERAALPVQVYIVDDIHLTALGKVFKPDLRLDAARRAMQRMIAPALQAHGGQAEITVAAHATHGTLASVLLRGPEGMRATLMAEVVAKLEPLTLRHEIAWSDESKG